MLLLMKTLIVLVWLVMFLIVVYSPKGSSTYKNDVIFDATIYGSGLEVVLMCKLRHVPVYSRLVIFDDQKDLMRSRIIERILVRNPGTVLRVPPSEVVNQLGQNP